MKRKPVKFAIGLFLLLSIGLIFHACRKAEFSTDQSKKTFDVATAKEWWYSTFRKSTVYLTFDSTSPFCAKPTFFSTKEHSIKYPV